ncbi:MAG TPA: hypothetical protein VM534_06910 [Thermoanaerobaculia bacterium]|nr:hypothetical protein [Thermoanaerobaculia bacterium]
MARCSFLVVLIALHAVALIAEISASREWEGAPIGGIRFGAEERPLFSPEQRRLLDRDLRRGLDLWARTLEGREMVRRYGRGGTVFVQIALEQGAGGALGSATPLRSLSSFLEGQQQFYRVVINPAMQGMHLDGVRTVGYVWPRSTAVLRALQIGAEMLHVDFFARGFPSGSHHSEPEFQLRWRAFAYELGCEGFPHSD